jgi:DDE superfamily endonuclease
MGDNGSRCKISVDGTDCPIREPSEFSSRWYSHKFKGPGLRYEVGICIQTGWIVWKNGPYPCGSFPDITIARDRLHNYMAIGEMYVADRGYKDGRQYGDCPTGYNTPGQRMRGIVRARHESVNARIKKFKILSTAFRNQLKYHYMAFHAIVNALQVEIQEGGTLYEVYYDDNALPN